MRGAGKRVIIDTLAILGAASAAVLVVMTGPWFAGTTEQIGAIVGSLALFLAVYALRRHRERTHIQEALSERERLYRELFENAHDVVYTIDLDGAFTSINQAGERLIGQPGEKALVGLPINRVLSPQHHGWVRDVIAQHLAGKASVMSELEVLAKSGRRVPMEVNTRLIHRDGEVTGVQAIARDIDERKRFEKQLLHLASHDPLTDLFNRRRFEEELQQHVAESRRTGVRSSVLFLDLDYFKDINDTLGHWAGDELLTRVGHLLRQRLRETDILARLGGDEFTVILPHTELQAARLVTEQLLTLLRNQPFDLAGQSFVITASAGIALIPVHGNTAEELLSHADLAMYQAKENGRNRLCVYNPDTDWKAQTESRINWRKRIGEALERDEFELFAQPILDLSSNEVTQYELLLRMLDKDGGVIDAGAFIASAERFGLMPAIDRWVVRRGIGMAAEFARQGRDVVLEINISGKAFADDELLPIIRNEVTNTGVDPRNLIFEVTESAAIHNIHSARDFVSELRSIGCRFALDDFGVGFSSFYQLKSLDVDYLKIDGSFIQDLTNDTSDRHLVKAMVEVARALNKETIAEFVGDQETLDLLRYIGVGFAQGYFIGKPGRASALFAARSEREPVPLAA